MDKHLYFLLEEESNWIIRREIKSLKLTQSKTFYQILPCMPTIEVDKIDERCPVKIDNLTIYRSEYKIPDMWETEVGPIIRRILSIDNYNEFKIISQSDWEAKSKNPYYKKNKQLYCIFEDNYLWFPKEHPKNINIDAAFKDSVSKLEYCKCGENDSDCTPYLDTLFTVPKYLYSEIVEKE